MTITEVTQSLIDQGLIEEAEEYVRLQEQIIEAQRYDWSLQARPEQLPPEGDWNVWLILAGRGWGKTRTGAEWIKDNALGSPNTRWAIVAPTFRDARDTCVEGESGLLGIVPQTEVVYWNRSFGQLRFRNGSQVQCFGATEPDRLRGPQHHGAWCDELASWPYAETWDQLMFGLRLGVSPRTVVTTTPKPTRLVRGLVERSDGADLDGIPETAVEVTRGNTFDNAANLAPAALVELKTRYEGTRLGRQELYAELLTDVEGALWTYDMLEANRVREAPELTRVVVALDPAVTSGEDSDESGIIVAGQGTDGHAYILADRSGRFTPQSTMQRLVHAYTEFAGDRVVIERNNGADYLPAMLRSVDATIPTKTVHASRGKQTRAEPIAALYEQGKVHHVGMFPELEEQLTTWTPNDGKSPDRLDALVWALTELMLERGRRTLSFAGAA